ncbi:MAG: hypothetical protein K1X74_14125 [Pirellulales bacterium]|nr:hypothetical protein [Pirellulales bacterium]
MTARAVAASFRRWMRVVLPPPALLAIACTMWLLFSVWPLGLNALFFFWSGDSHRCFSLEQVRELARPGMRILSYVLMVLYGLYRVFWFHPTYWQAYREWMLATPWTRRDPLPLGPVHLVPQDAVVWLSLGAANYVWLGNSLWFETALALVIGWLVAALPTLIDCEAYASAYGVAFLLIALLFQHKLPTNVALLVAIAYAIAWWGLHMSMARFPWPVHRYPKLRLVRNSGREAGAAEGIWPWNRLVPVDGDLDSLGLARPEVVLLPLLVTAFLSLTALDVSGETEIRVPQLGIGLIAAVVRLFFYIHAYLPTISVAGRIRTGRLWMPRHDVVYLAPVATVLTTLFGPWVLRELGCGHFAACLIANWLSLTIVLGFPPSLRAWQFTGQHRIVAGSRAAQFAEV